MLIYKVKSLVFITIAACLANIVPAYAQIGNPFIQNFPPKYYSHLSTSPQNLSIIQDNRGVTYIANVSGIFEMAGSELCLVKNTESTPFISLAIGGKGEKIYAAGGDIGYLTSDTLGAMSFHSLSGKILSKEGGHYEVVASSGFVYFYNKSHLLVWNGVEMKEYQEKDIWRAYIVDERLLYIKGREGMKTLKGDSLVFVEGNDQILGKYPVNIFPISTGKYLVPTWGQGFFIWDGKEMKKLETEADLLANANIYKAIMLHNGYIALTLFRKGILIIDRHGSLVQIIDKSKGLYNNMVHALFEDNKGGLWAGLDKGYSHIEIATPLSYFDAKNGLSGNIISVLVHDNKVFCGSTAGAYVLDIISEEPTFTHLRGLLETWGFLSSPQGVLLGGNGGVWNYHQGKVQPILSGELKDVNCFYQSKTDSNRVFVGTDQGLASIYFDKSTGGWNFEGHQRRVKEGVGKIIEDSEGFLWVAMRRKLLYRLKFNPSGKSEVESFGTEQGLISDYEKVFLSEVNGGILFLVHNRVYTYNDITGSFDPHPVLDKLSSVYEPAVKSVIQLPDGETWMANERHFGKITGNPGNESWEISLSNRMPESTIWDLGCDQEGNVWCAATDGLFRYDRNVEVSDRQVFKTLIRKFTVGKDSVLFYGMVKEEEIVKGSNFYPLIDYEHNSISVSYASVFMDAYEKNEYSYLLEGNDETWSNWAKENYKEYTNLSPGNYVFRVKSRNVYGREGEEASLRFVVLPPWYMTWWACGMYGIGGLLLFVGGIKLNSRRLEREKQILEGIVAERTNEIVRQKDEIAMQKKELDDSIHYARNIQQAILPDEKEIGNSLPDHFVFFQPKDVVSGDFYWFHDNGKKVFIIAADCTGHGVPGAFVSMVGNNLLNQVVIEKKISDPGRILKRLNIGVNIAFKREGSIAQSNDGMDIAVCVVDKTKKHVDYAGAQNPLIRIRNSDVLVTKADNTPIGGRTSINHTFTTHRIDAEEKDAFYIFSDGYPDQFGGPKGKKFMIRRFKEMLAGIHDQPFKQQAQHLERTFSDWKGKEEQVDDVLVIGFSPV